MKKFMGRFYSPARSRLFAAIGAVALGCVIVGFSAVSVVYACETQPPKIDLSVTKTVDNTAPYQGDTVHYTITVSAMDSSISANVVATDVLPAGLSFVSVSSSIGTYASSTGIWKIGTMKAHSTAKLVIAATVTASAGTLITNKVTVNESSSSPGSNSNSDSTASITIKVAKNYPIYKTLTVAVSGLQNGATSSVMVADMTAGTTTATMAGNGTIPVVLKMNDAYAVTATTSAQNYTVATSSGCVGTLSINASCGIMFALQQSTSTPTSTPSSTVILTPSGGALTQGQVGVLYAPAIITASDAVASDTFTLDVSGVLPDGLTVATTATAVTIAGTPTASGTFNFSVDAASILGIAQAAHGDYSITITAANATSTPSSTAPIVTISPASGALTDGMANVNYGPMPFTADDGIATDTFTWIETGALPSGLTFNASSVTIFGTPTMAATSSFSITATSVSYPLSSSTNNYTLTVNPAPPVQTSTLNISLMVDNTVGGSATPSDFTVTVIAGHPSVSTFSGDASGTAVTIDANQAYYVNVSSLSNYAEGKSGNCDDVSGLPSGNLAMCTITETYSGSALTVVSVNALADIDVANGTALDAAGLPATVGVALSDGTHPSYAVTWNGGSPSYDGATAGTYAFAGVLTLPVNVSNPNNLKASVNVVVAAALVPAIVVNNGGGGGSVSGGGGSAYELAINGGAAQTATTSVMLSLYGTGAYMMEISNTSDFASSTWIPYATVLPWILTSDSGQKTVYAQYRSIDGDIIGAANASINLVQGQVLGASTSCGIYLRSYVKRGTSNDPQEVKKLQIFLNENLGINLPVTGYYGPLTYSAVEQFQVKYGHDVLSPWVSYGLQSDTTPTGYVYKTTQRWINELMCSQLNLPVPQLP